MEVEPLPPRAGLVRAFTSSFFGFFFVALSAFYLAPDVAKRIAGADQGATYLWIWSATWLIGAGFGGFVAGYRAAGRGALAGFLNGVWVMIVLGGSFIAVTVSWVKDNTVVGMLGVDGFAGLLRELLHLFGDQMTRFGVTLALCIIVGAWAGIRGESFYSEIGRREDQARHTLFAIPWWHWIWLLAFLPGFMISDLMLSGHLFALATVAIFKHFLLGLLPFVGTFILAAFYLVGASGLYATFAGAANLWDALAIDSGLATGRRWAKALWGLFLINAFVYVAWAFASRFLLANLR